MRAPELLTPAEAAARCGVTTDTMRERASRGEVACVRTPCGHRRYIAADIDAYLGRLVMPDPRASQRETLARALSDAVAYRRPEGPCPDCEELGELCEDDAADLARSLMYLDLAAELGLSLEG